MLRMEEAYDDIYLTCIWWNIVLALYARIIPYVNDTLHHGALYAQEIHLKYSHVSNTLSAPKPFKVGTCCNIIVPSWEKWESRRARAEIPERSEGKI